MGTFFAAIFLIGIFALAVYLIAYGISHSRVAPTSQENLIWRHLVYRLDKIAHDNRDVNPELAVQVIDEIQTTRDAIERAAFGDRAPLDALVQDQIRLQKSGRARPARRSELTDPKRAAAIVRDARRRSS
jgi:demethoxyubiquinone hydroxylase (CLK1/Coq7/Cat5 family)